MQRDELDRHIANNGRTEIDLYEEPPGEWVRLADTKEAGLRRLRKEINSGE